MTIKVTKPGTSSCSQACPRPSWLRSGESHWLQWPTSCAAVWQMWRTQMEHNCVSLVFPGLWPTWTAMVAWTSTSSPSPWSWSNSSCRVTLCPLPFLLVWNRPLSPCSLSLALVRTRTLSSVCNSVILSLFCQIVVCFSQLSPVTKNISYPSGMPPLASMAPPLTGVPSIPIPPLPVGVSPPLVPSGPPSIPPPIANGAPSTGMMQPISGFPHPGKIEAGKLFNAQF